MITKRKVQKLVKPGDTVYIICSWGVVPSEVIEVLDDCIETKEDTLFFDEHRTTWMFTESEAKKMALKSQKSVIKC